MKDKLIESWDIAKEVAFEGKEGNYYNFVVVRLFFLKSGGTSVNVDHEGEYFFSTDEPEENDEVRTKLVTDLFDASMKWRIQKTFKRLQEIPVKSSLNERFKHGYYVLGYKLYLEESLDGQTNITPEIVESFGGIFGRRKGVGHGQET